jgi:hypothetical protein
MAVVFAGLTLLQLLDILVALAALGLDAPKLVALAEKLKAKAHPLPALIPPEHTEELRAGLMEIAPRPGATWGETHAPEGG